MRPLLVALSLAGFVSLAPAQVLNVSTLAGSADGGGYVDARGTAARFSDPQGVAVDSNGNVFVADTGNHVIRKITPAGDVTTFAGTPHLVGATDGKPGTFRFPAGIAINKATNDVYVADTENFIIRKITPDGTVSTVAGLARNLGFADGRGSAARFSTPVALAVTPNGTVYVADAFNENIRKIAPDGDVSTLAEVFHPHGIAVDPLSGTVYVTSQDDFDVVKIAPDGTRSTLAGQYGEDNADGTGTAAHFIGPHGLALDAAGNLMVTDASAGLVRQITPAGVVTTIAGHLDRHSGLVDGNGADAHFNGATGIAVDAAGNLYVADEFNAVIRRIAPSRDVTTFAGDAPKWGSADGTGTSARFTFPAPAGVAVDAGGNTWVTDATNVLKKITPAGVVTTVAGLAGAAGSQDGTGSAARFDTPTGVAVDPRDGSIIVADAGNHTIRRVTPQGIVTTIAGRVGVAGSDDGTGAAATFDFPCGVTVDGSGTIYVADFARSRIRKVTPAGVVSTFANPFGRVQLSSPTAVAVDAAGNVFLTDSANKVKKVTPDGVVSVVAGNGGDGFADGVGLATLFSRPFGLALDRDGNLYVADTGNHLIRRVTPGAVVTTVAGVASSPGNVNGPGIAARFSTPIGIAVAPDGRIVIADLDNDAIRIATVIPTVRGRAVQH